MKNQVSKKRMFKSLQTARTKRFYEGVVISLILISTPFLFYLYRLAPGDSVVWETSLFTLSSGGFITVQSFVWALFTKLTLVIITSLFFLTNNRYWKPAILVPLTMFLYQLSGVLNTQLDYIDNYDFWKSLPITIPIIIIHVILAKKLNSKANLLNLNDQLDEEIRQTIQENNE